jgi:hypothetical protein
VPGNCENGTKQEVDDHHRRQHHEECARQIREEFSDQDRTALNRAREEIGDGLVIDFVGHQRRAVEDAEHRDDESQEQHPHDRAEDAEAGDTLAVDAQRRHAERLDRLHDQGQQDRSTDDERHEDRSPRPEHFAERQIENPARCLEERHPAEGRQRRGVAVHCFTRYLKTA